MEIKGNIHLLFEQSGVFKQAFKELGYSARTYDIRNDYGNTDVKIDLFVEIGKAAQRKKSIFDNINSDDLVIAFFPCTYFSEANELLFKGVSMIYKNENEDIIFNKIRKRSKMRNAYFEKLLQLVAVVKRRKLRLVVENPYSTESYLIRYLICDNKYIDMDRSRRGDYFKKPTVYFFYNSEPTAGYTVDPNFNLKKISNISKDKSGTAMCGRSEIAPRYARNFIKDNILGIKVNNLQLKLWD